MWLNLLSGLIFSCVLLYLPGLTGARLAGGSRAISVAVAPFLSLFALYVSAFLFRTFGVADCWWNLAFFSFVLVFVTAMVFRFIAKGKSKEISCHTALRFELKIVALYIFVSLVVCGLIFVKTLDGAGSIYQENDNIFHLNTIRDFVDSGVYCLDSPLSYPALWHTLVATVFSFSGGSIPVAVNAVNLALIAVVCPLSFMVFLSAVFKNRSVVIAGSVCSLAVAEFPWGFLLFGPLYPNLLGYLLLIGVAALFVVLLKPGSAFSRSVLGALFLIGCFVLLVSHPNAVFVGVVLLTPYCISAIYRSSTGFVLKGLAIPKGIAICSFIGIVFCIWAGLYFSPIFSGVVSFEWPAYLGVGQAVYDLLSLSLTKASAPQYALSFLTIVGSLTLLAKRKNRWLVCSCLIFGFFYIVNVSSDGFLKHFLTGFWYSDSFRVAAALAIAVVPLASVGLAAIIRWFMKLAGEKRDVESNGALMLSMLALASIVLYFPNHEIPKNSYAVTGFGQVSMMLEKGNSLFVNQAPLDSEEIEFAKKTKEIVGNDRVFNIPFDGSAYLYAINDMNVANKRWYGFANDGSDDSVIRNSLNEVASNPEVDRALRDEGVRYLILLDNGMTDGLGGMFGDQLHQDEWRGVLFVTDNTPGLKLLLSEDDMRLYEIQY